MRIAVCIPTYNRADTLAEAIESLLRQRRTAFDVHVFDNASTDGTADLINRLYLGRIIHHRHQANLGYVGNVNACFALKRDYDWIGILHSDDRHEGDSVTWVQEMIAAHSQAGLIFSAANLMNARGIVFQRGTPGFRVFRKGAEAVARCQGQLPCSTIFYRAEAIAEVGGYDPSFPNSADEEHNARIAGKFDIVEADHILASYRRHDGHLMTKSWLAPDFIDNYEKMRVKIAGYAGLPHDEALTVVRRELGRNFLSCASDLASQGYYRRALAFYGYAWKHNRPALFRPVQMAKAAAGLLPIGGPLLLRAGQRMRRAS